MKDYFCNKDSDTLHQSRLFSFIPVFRFSQLEFSGLCAPFGSFWHFEIALEMLLRAWSRCILLYLGYIHCFVTVFCILI